MKLLKVGIEISFGNFKKFCDFSTIYLLQKLLFCTNIFYISMSQAAFDILPTVFKKIFNNFLISRWNENVSARAWSWASVLH